jgi:hypothetical protein
MPFDPTKPANNTPILSAELRNQFNGLFAIMSALVPIGIILPFAKDLAGVPALSANFAECNGQVLSDAESPLNGITLPDLNNAQRFLRGSSLSGTTGGAETHTHDIEVGSGFDGVNVDTGGSGQALQNNPTTTSAGSSLPPYYEVVWVMRVK